MQALRLIIVVVTALALAGLPMYAGIAKPPVAKAEASISAPDEACPGCDASHDQVVEACSQKCCGTAAIPVEAQSLTGQRRIPAEGKLADALAPFTLPPDPPPPRS